MKNLLLIVFIVFFSSNIMSQQAIATNYISINPESLTSLFGSSMSDAEHLLDSLNFKNEKAKTFENGLIFKTFISSQGDDINIFFTSDSTVCSFNLVTKNSALPYLQYLDTLGFTLEDDMCGYNPAYFFSNEDVEIFVIEHFDGELTTYCYNSMSIFEQIKGNYEKKPSLRGKENRWQAFKDILVLKNAKGKTLNEMLQHESALFEPMIFSDLQNQINNKTLQNINKIIDKEFLNDKSFVKQLNQLMQKISKPFIILKAGDKPEFLPDATERVMENYFTFRKLKHIAYAICYIKEQTK
jgi:hypothetical protein